MQARIIQSLSRSAVIACLSFPLSVISAPSEELLEKAGNGDAEAQFNAGQQYLEDDKLKQAHFWLLQSALNGNPSAISKLGKLFEQQQNLAVSGLPYAENWYEIGSNQGIEEAEEGYARVLEEQFNQRRIKQVSSIAVLDKAADAALAQPAPLTNSSKIVGSNRISTDILIISLILCVALLYFGFRRFFRNKKQAKENNLQKKLKNKDRKIRTLQNNLNRTFEQLKKLKKLQQQNQKQSQDQSFAMACTLMGYHPNKIPDEKAIKLRYKKLCRIYHPDANGSQEEMKRLNAAVKIITARKNRA